MFKNYLKTAFRNFRHNKVFAFINVAGLAIGISASLVIYLLVSYHFTFDKFEKDKERIYRVVTEFNFSGEAYYNSGVTSPIGAAIKKELTGFNAVVPFRTWDSDAKIYIPVADKKEPLILKHEKNIVFADDNYFNLIGYQWLAGSPQTALTQPYQVVLTQSVAGKYFPNLQPAQILGKQFYINDTVGVTVSGILKDITANTDFTFTTFISKPTLEATTLKPGDYDDWNNTNGASQLYVKLASGKQPAQLEKAILNLFNQHHTNDRGDNSKRVYHLQPLNDVHFNADYRGYEIPVVSKPILYGLLAVAAFLLLLGCINFINLTTAQSSQRAKEIGIRKTMGSSKKQLVIQFLSETFLLTLVATLLSVALTPLLLKAFAGFIPEGLHFSLTAQPGVVVFLFSLIITVTILSGFYPAIILSSYKPVLVLKNQAYTNTGKTRKAWLRKSLTASQFVIAQFFIMATLLVSRQINYSLHKDMGFKKDAIVYFNINFYDASLSNRTILRNRLKAIPEIAMVSLSTDPPSSNSTWSGTIKYKDGKKEIEADVQQKYGDTNYINLYHLKLLAGNNLPQSDTVNSFLINETYAHILGFKNPGQAIGKNVEWSDKQIPIAGVIKDFNQSSLHEPVKPLVIGSWAGSQRLVSIELQPQNSAGTTWKTALAKAGKAFKEVYPEDDFDYTFFDADIAKYYTQEQNISGLLKWATGLAVFISCLGLLGLVMYTTTQRVKEIGVRKVLGASVMQIIALISKEFVLLVLFAFVIAVPVAWLAANKWLQNFAYRTSISWWLFALAGACMLVIALLTLCFQAIKAATANPVESLRTE